MATYTYTQVINSANELVFIVNGSSIHSSKDSGIGCTCYISNSDGSINPSGNYVTVTDSGNNLYVALYSTVTNPSEGSAASLQSVINQYINGGAGGAVTQAAVTAALGLAPNLTALGTDAGGNVIAGSAPSGGYTTAQTPLIQVNSTTVGIQAGNGSQNGYIASADWTKFNNAAGYFTSTTAASSSTLAAAAFAGGVAIAKNIWAGGAYSAAYVSGTGAAFTVPAFTFTDSNTASTNPAVYATNYIGQVTLSATNANTYAVAASLYINNAPVAGGSATITPYSLYVNSGVVKINDSTAAVSSTTGCLVLAGGLGVSGALYLTSFLQGNRGVSSSGGATGINYSISNSQAASSSNIFNQFIAASTAATGSALLNSTTANTGGTTSGSSYSSLQAVTGTVSITGVPANGVTVTYSAVECFLATSVISNATAGGINLVTNLYNFRATDVFFSGAGTQTVTNYHGFSVDDVAITKTTNVYGFRSLITSGSNKYSLYFDGTAQNYLNGVLGLGTTPSSTAWLKIGAGTATVASIVLAPGANNTTVQSGALEYNGNHYLTQSSGIRYSVGGTIQDWYTSEQGGNGGTTPNIRLFNLTTSTTNPFNTNGDKVFITHGGTFTSTLTVNPKIQVVFAGTTIFDTGSLTLSSPPLGTAPGWSINIMLIRVSPTTIRCVTTASTSGASTSAYSEYVELTGLNLTVNNSISMNFISAGAGTSPSDIVVTASTAKFQPAY